MTSKESIQTSFLEQIKQGLKPTISFADELAEVLNLSRDSAYRRIRGETVLSLDEVKVLSNHYGVSLDALLSPSQDRVCFQLRALHVENFSLQKWLTGMLVNLETLIAVHEQEKQIFYDAKDLPIFYYFQFPRLAAFKLYFWGRFFSHDSKFDSEKYHQGIVGNELIALGEKIWDRYSSIPSTEIIRLEMITVTIRQIEYLHQCGLFADKDDAKNLCDDCSQLTTHLQVQAQKGIKTTFGTTTAGAKLDLYHNDLLIGDNTVLFKMGEKRMAFITPSNFNLLITSHAPFCKVTEDHMNNLINKSVLISASGEKERSRFFNMVEEATQSVRERVI